MSEAVVANGVHSHSPRSRSNSGESRDRHHQDHNNDEFHNPAKHIPREHHTEFAASAALHISDVVNRLTAEHERLVASLRQENQHLRAKLGESTTFAVNNGDAGEHGVDAQLMSHGRGKFVVDIDEPVGCDRKQTWQKSEIAFMDAHSKQTVIGSSRSRLIAGSKPTLQTNRVTLEDEEVLTPQRHEGVTLVESIAYSSSGSQIDTTDETGCRYWKNRIVRWVRNGKFDSFVGVVIVSNTIVMSMQLEYNGRVFEDEVINACSDCQARSNAIEFFFIVMEHLFTAIFAIELVIRLFVDGFGYLLYVSNFLDGIIVIVSMADSWLLGPLGSDVLGSVAVLRLMRLLRLAKILRVVRVMKAFRSLRVLVTAVVNSVGALAWSMTLLFVLELCGAIFMAQVIQPFMEETADEALRKYIWKHFGTWTNSMFTIFEITMAPGGFIQYRRLYEEVHPLFGIFCITYVCLVTFAVVRVITAMFLKATLSASDTEEQASASEKTKELAAYVKSMQGKRGMDGTRTINRADVENLLDMGHFSDWIEDAGITPREVLRLWSSLDEGTHEVPIAEFESALRQIRGVPRATDIVTNLNLTKNMMLRLLRMQNTLEDTLGQRLPECQSHITKSCRSAETEKTSEEYDLRSIAPVA